LNICSSFFLFELNSTSRNSKLYHQKRQLFWIRRNNIIDNMSIRGKTIQLLLSFPDCGTYCESILVVDFPKSSLNITFVV